MGVRRLAERFGFTLVELMAVVVVLGILSTVAISGFQKYRASVRQTEVLAMFGEIRAKEEAYRAEWTQYYWTQASEGTYEPSSVTPNAQAWSPSSTSAWYLLGITPVHPKVYCGYNILANSASMTGGSASTLGAAGSAWFGGGVPTVPWWYSMAICDNDNDAAVNATFITSMDNVTFHVSNPAR